MVHWTQTISCQCVCIRVFPTGGTPVSAAKQSHFYDCEALYKRLGMKKQADATSARLATVRETIKAVSVVRLVHNTVAMCGFSAHDA